MVTDELVPGDNGDKTSRRILTKIAASKNGHRKESQWWAVDAIGRGAKRAQLSRKRCDADEHEQEHVATRARKQRLRRSRTAKTTEIFVLHHILYKRGYARVCMGWGHRQFNTPTP